MNDFSIPDLNPPTPVATGKPIIVAGCVPTPVKVVLWIIRLFTLLVFLSCIVAPDIFTIAICISIFWFAIELLFVGNALRRRWVLQTDDGFIYSSLFGSETYSYNDIEGVSLRVREQPTMRIRGGIFLISVRDLNIYITGKAKPLRFHSSAQCDTSDPLIEFIESVANNVNERLDSLYRDREPIDGDHWRLSEDVIEWHGKSGDVISLPCSEITALHSFDDKLHLWQNGEQTACLTLPLYSKNVQWLAEFIEENVEQPEQTDTMINTTTDAPDSWGRFLFERKRAPLIIYITLALIAPAIILPMVFLAPMMEIEFKIAYSCSAVFWCLLLFIIRVCDSGKEFYENGIVVTKTFSKREIIFDNVESVCWKRHDMFHKGGYIGTKFFFYICLFHNAGQRKLNLTFTNRKGDSGGHFIVFTNIVNRIANRMKQGLAEHKTLKLVAGYILLKETSFIV
ncbi:MAG: hypothetical protein LBU65_14375 [Planctomycetaceae bacterium]|jgi:hypothetical protein|nr:hypothetical protein [Planctomycetaceae bacterium]